MIRILSAAILLGAGTFAGAGPALAQARASQPNIVNVFTQCHPFMREPLAKH